MKPLFKIRVIGTGDIMDVIYAPNLLQNNMPDMTCKDLSMIALSEDISHRRQGLELSNWQRIINERLPKAKAVDQHTFKFFTTPGNLLKLKP